MATKFLRKVPKSLVSQRFKVAVRCLASEAGSATMPLTFGSPQTVLIFSPDFGAMNIFLIYTFHH